MEDGVTILNTALLSTDGSFVDNHRERTHNHMTAVSRLTELYRTGGAPATLCCRYTVFVLSYFRVPARAMLGVVRLRLSIYIYPNKQGNSTQNRRKFSIVILPNA